MANRSINAQFIQQTPSWAGTPDWVDSVLNELDTIPVGSVASAAAASSVPNGTGGGHYSPWMMFPRRGSATDKIASVATFVIAVVGLALAVAAAVAAEQTPSGSCGGNGDGADPGVAGVNKTTVLFLRTATIILSVLFGVILISSGMHVLSAFQ